MQLRSPFTLLETLLRLPTALELKSKVFIIALETPHDLASVCLSSLIWVSLHFTPAQLLHSQGSSLFLPLRTTSFSAQNIIPILMWFHLGKLMRSSIAGSYGRSTFSFKETAKLFSEVTVPLCIFHQQ